MTTRPSLRSIATLIGSALLAALPSTGGAADLQAPERFTALAVDRVGIAHRGPRTVEVVVYDWSTDASAPCPESPAGYVMTRNGLGVVVIRAWQEVVDGTRRIHLETEQPVVLDQTWERPRMAIDPPEARTRIELVIDREGTGIGQIGRTRLVDVH